MAKEFFIVNSKFKESNPNFYSFENPLETKSKVDKVLSSENCKWSQSEVNDGLYLQAFYENEIAYLKIEILKTKSSKNYIFKLTVFDGENPLSEVSRLCKINSWNAFEVENAEYLDLDNYPNKKISKEAKEKYLNDYWNAFNEAQDEMESENLDDETYETSFNQMNHYENIILLISDEKNKEIKEFDDFKEAIKYGKLNLKFNYDANLINVLSNNNNIGFYNIIKNIKNFGLIICLIYIVFWVKDYKILFIIPIVPVIGRILDYFWNRKIILTILLIFTILITCNYLNLNYYYKYILISLTILQAMLYSIYNSFLEQEFTYDETRFNYAVENKLINKIYVTYTKKYHNI